MLQISGSTLSKLVKIKKIRSLKLGRLRRFSVDDISAYLAAHED
ncbi:MAG TPA: DNA-binding protein [Deltaproteobacteria bacterium]|nr:DNA-binding protein [Deltaproteobacteria bacterium]